MIKRLWRRLRDVLAYDLRVQDRGMTTAEYAVGTVAAVAFAAVLYKVVRSGEVQAALTSIIHTALTAL